MKAQETCEKKNIFKYMYRIIDLGSEINESRECEIERKAEGERNNYAELLN